MSGSETPSSPKPAGASAPAPTTALPPVDPANGTLRMPAPKSASGGPSGPLSHINLFLHLDEREQAGLLNVMKRMHVGVNETIVWHGDTGDSLYLIERGRVSVTVPSHKGEHVTLDVLEPGAIFGEISLLDGGPRTATIRAVEAADLLVLDRGAFRQFLTTHPDAVMDILTVMGHRQRASTEALRGMRNPNDVFESSRLTLWQRISDVIATTAASQAFTMFHAVWFGAWILVNVTGLMSFDPFPFGLLTMVVSLEAIFLAIFVMVSQNRQSEKDRLRTDLDYQVNVKAQTEIMQISRRLERIEEMVKKP